MKKKWKYFLQKFLLITKKQKRKNAISTAFKKDKTHSIGVREIYASVFKATHT